MNDSKTRYRRWLRFSLRTLFVLMTVFCVWLGVQVKWVRDRHEAINWVLLPGYSKEHSFWQGIVAKPKRAPFPLWIVGEPGFEEISVSVSRPDRIYSEEQLQSLFPEATFAGYVW
jgi:hypothetical protein